jgi:CMP/dCMP kinase
VIVAIDGPAGAGKSTVAKLVADRLGMGYLDTGAMYRAVALVAAREGVVPDDGRELAALTARHAVRLDDVGGTLRVRVNEEDVSTAIRAAGVTATVSAVSAHPEVRRAMVALQREVMAKGDWVVDGRDIGTVVWPQAEVKVFLTADPGVRAERRRRDLAALGSDLPLDEVHADILRRDHLDSTREDSPLRQADDAVLMDTSGLSVDDVVSGIVQLATRARASA